MKVVALSGTGGPEVLRIEERPDPVCGPEDVRVLVHATALNRADLLQRRGLYPAPPDAPIDVPGLEFAGEVIEIGPRVKRLRIGAALPIEAAAEAHARMERNESFGKIVIRVAQRGER